jgi:hypothetical protein|tara:strand:+ start:79 stop:225 length:147 start_codon:yes stop_codon:yes gene_type:complete
MGTRAWRKKGLTKRRLRALDTLQRYEPQSKQQMKEIDILIERTKNANL